MTTKVNKLADNKKYLENYRLYSNKPNPIQKKRQFFKAQNHGATGFLWVGGII